MKNSLIVIAGILLIIWGIIYWAFDSSGEIHILLAVAAFIILFRIVFNRQLSIPRR